MDIKKLPSPNFNDRPKGCGVEALVIHYTGMKTAKEALDRLTAEGSNVSAHYTIDEDGTIYQHVDEKKRAWHAGVSHWRGRDSVNDFSVGIEIVNPGHEFGYREFTEAQKSSVLALAKKIVNKHKIPAQNVVGHSDIAPMRKEDPGELFDWALLALNGVGMWPDITAFDYKRGPAEVLTPGSSGKAVEKMQKALKEYGYGIKVTGEFDELSAAVVTAFRRHFIRDQLEPVWNSEAEAVLASMVGKVEV